MKRSFLALFVGVVCSVTQGCGGDVGVATEAVVASFVDLKREADEEYGKGAGRALTELPFSKGPRAALNAGSERILAIDHHRQTINALRERGEISEEEEGKRINQLFASYEQFRSGRKSQSAFENEAAALSRP